MVTIRPLAGTRRRGRDEAEDRALAAELLADPKERAEHIMLVDLGRNDVGRVADFATRAADRRDEGRALLARHAHHLERDRPAAARARRPSTPSAPACPPGRSRARRRSAPCRSSTRSSPSKRGPYAGAVGYIDFTGNMDTCIALRTLVLQGKTAYVQAGGGVVYDSVPGDEYEETVNKARGLLKAIEIAETQLGR